MTDNPTPKPCPRHAAVGREYDEGCYSCRRLWVEELARWQRSQLTALRALMTESVFVETAQW